MATQQVQVRRNTGRLSIVAVLVVAVLVAAVLVAGAFGLGILASRGFMPVAATGAGNGPIVEGSSGGGIRYTGIPYPAPDARAGAGNGLIVEGSSGGSIRYRGIPYPAPDAWAGSRRDPNAARTAADGRRPRRVDGIEALAAGDRAGLRVRVGVVGRSRPTRTSPMSWVLPGVPLGPSEVWSHTCSLFALIASWSAGAADRRGAGTP